MSTHYDLAFIGGGLSTYMLLNELKPHIGNQSICVIEPVEPENRPVHHWSYWSKDSTYYDKHAIGAWQQAKFGTDTVQTLAPYTLRVVRSTDVLRALREDTAELKISHISSEARHIVRRDDKYEIRLPDKSVSADWVFDSAISVLPAFPDTSKKHAVLSGNGMLVTGSEPVFDEKTAIMFDTLPDEMGMAYLLPLRPYEALVESAVFASQTVHDSTDQLLQYLQSRWPKVSFNVNHSEHGVIALGFPPTETAGPRHILIGAKRGLVRPSAGYGIMNISRESKQIARMWQAGEPIPVSRSYGPLWSMLDNMFLELAVTRQQQALRMIQKTMAELPATDCLSFIDETLPLKDLALFMTRMLPSVAWALLMPQYDTIR